MVVSVAGNKRGASGDGAMSVEPKRLRGVEHDLKVMVGNQTFHHYSYSLRLASEYFDTMLSMPMQEGITNVLKFPSRNPTEWSIVYQFLDPSSARSAKITNSNVQMLVPWFHEFQMHNLLTECDEVISSILSKYDTIHTGLSDLKKPRQEIKDLMDKVELCIKYDLKKSLNKGFAILTHLVENEACLFSQRLCSQLVHIMETQMAARQSLWPCIRHKLVTDRLRSATPEDVLDNPITRDLLVLVLASKSEMRSRRA